MNAPWTPPSIPPVCVPEGTSGAWSVKKFTVSEDAARLENLRASFGSGRHIRPGAYTMLKRGGVVVMSDTPAEKRDHMGFVRVAKGRVLINGLGLGMVLGAVLAKSEVESVTVVEKSADVIALVAATYAGDDRLTIINEDAYEFEPPKGIRYDAVWHDIWDNIDIDNLPEMARLHRKYGRIADWQGSWSKEICLYHRRTGR